MRILVASILSLLVSCSTSNYIKYSTFGDGLKSYDSKDYETAFKIWESLAKEGDAESAFRVADMYDFAQGVEQNFEKAAKWYRSAANQGHQHSQSRLANKYQWGSGVQKNILEAYKWYIICAKGDPNRIQVYCVRSMRTLHSVHLLNANSTWKYRIQEIENEAENWKPKKI